MLKQAMEERPHLRSKTREMSFHCCEDCHIAATSTNDMRRILELAGPNLRVLNIVGHSVAFALSLIPLSIQNINRYVRFQTQFVPEQLWALPKV